VSEPSFEADQTELEAIVERLERGDVELEELSRLWERGEALCRRLSAALSDARGRIEELSRQFDRDPREQGP
jgi:exodeoxyribonuclease VII small subunit